jgi:hypothetical protein
MNDGAATNPAMLSTMAARLAEATGQPIEAASCELRMAVALLAVGLGADPRVVNHHLLPFGLQIVRT